MWKKRKIVLQSEDQSSLVLQLHPDILRFLRSHPLDPLTAKGAAWKLCNSRRLFPTGIFITWAKTYNLGYGVPASLKPFFAEIGLHLSNLYLLTFAGSRGPKGKYESVKIKTELPGVEFFALKDVYLPPSK